MPPKRLKGRQSAAALLASRPPARVSRQIEAFTRRLANVVSFAASDTREAEGAQRPSRTLVGAASTADNAESDRAEGMTPPSTLSQSGTAAKDAHRPSDDSPLRVGGDDGVVQQGDVSRTEMGILRQHGHLSQLDDVYLARRSGSRRRSIARDGANGEEESEKEREERLQRRRRALLRIPTEGLALYTRLAECGIDAVDRPFVTCVVRRAQSVVEEWTAGFL